MGNLGLQELVLLLFVFFFGFGLPFLYLNTLRKTLQLIDIKNRTIDPNYVWFMYIIFFNLFYHFHIVNSIATSLSNEFSDRNIAVDEKRPGETIGFINSIFLVLWFINAFTKFDPEAINFILSLGALITWIIYWVKIRKYKKLLIADNINKLGKHEL
jgi:hypothetical protein